MDILGEIIKNTGVYQYGCIDPSKARYHQNIREICEGNACRSYGTTWACPPAVGTVEECRERCAQYNAMLLFSAKYELEDSFDIEGMHKGMREFKKVARRLDGVLKPYLDSYLVLSNEGCGTCASCTYPAAPCRFPEKLHHSIEGYGLIVSELAGQAGIKYNNGENTVTYFGAVLFNKEEAARE